MSLNEVLWSKLDLSEFGSLENVEIFDEPKIVEISDYNNPLQYGLGICYLDDKMNDLYIMHASCKHKDACGIVWDIYSKYHKRIDEILGVSSSISRVDPARCGDIFPTEIIEKYGGELS